MKICFSLWGKNKKYLYGAVKNAALSKIHFPEWECMFFVDESVDDETLSAIDSHNNINIVKDGFQKFENRDNNEYGKSGGYFWRFIPMFESNDIIISRDVDSRLSERDRISVYEWLNSDKNFHTIRDHPVHRKNIQAGMFGVRNGILVPYKDLFFKFVGGSNSGTDEDFLNNAIYPLVSNSIFVHDEFRGFNKINHTRNGYEYIGRIFNEHDIAEDGMG